MHGETMKVAKCVCVNRSDLRNLQKSPDL